MSTPNTSNIPPPAPTPLHVQYPSLPPPPKSGNTAPSQSGANAPSFLKIQDGRKVYSVRGVTFEIDQHYELIKAIGLGAYGLVCSAVDLRWVPDSPFFDKEMVDREIHGGAIVKSTDGNVYHYTPKKSASSSGNEKEGSSTSTSTSGGGSGSTAGPKVLVPTLRYEGYTRGKLSNGMPSPYVAIKKVPKLFNDLIDGKRVLREVKILQYLKGHENIVRMHDLLYPRQPMETFRDLYLVSELLDTDLHLVLKSRQPLEEDHLRFIIFQLVKSLVYIHSSGIIHRDLKPGNLLLTGSCELKVCDFGLARGGIPMPLPRASTGSTGGGAGGSGGAASKTPQQTSIPKSGSGHLGAPQANMVTASPILDQLSTKKASSGIHFEKSVENAALSTNVGNNNNNGGGDHDHHGALDLTDYVITRYYRPPELLIMSHYHHAVDMWSVGCILAEIILHKPAFPGKDYLSQLTLIAQTQGLPCMPKAPDQIDQYFVGGMEGKNYLKDLLFGKARRGTKTGSTTVSPAQGDLPAPSPHTEPLLTKPQMDQLRTSLFGPDGHRYISDQAMQFLAPTLSFDPAQRPTALQALRHPYFAKMYNPEDEIWKELPSTAAAAGSGAATATSGSGTSPNTASIAKHTSWVAKYPKVGSCGTEDHGPAVPLAPPQAPNSAVVALDYESEEDESTAMWAFDHKELQEGDLRRLFWGEMERFQRRRLRTKDAKTRNAKAEAAQGRSAAAAAAAGGDSPQVVPTPPFGGSPSHGGRRGRESSSS